MYVLAGLSDVLALAVGAVAAPAAISSAAIARPNTFCLMGTPSVSSVAAGYRRLTSPAGADKWPDRVIGSSGAKAHDSDMAIVLGMTFMMVLLAVLWLAAEEPTEAVLAVRQVNPDQTEDDSAWDLMGWTSFG